MQLLQRNQNGNNIETSMIKYQDVSFTDYEIK